MSSKPSDTRSHEHALDIHASPADVWRAITEASELVRWFPLGAETTPGAGGEIVYRWGELAGRCRILAWEPTQHLRTTWMEAPAGGSAPEFTVDAPEAERNAVCVDWFLAGAGGTTKLRVVHSGFGRSAAWDKEYDGTNRGWTFELQVLKHYLERHRGEDRRAAWVRQPIALSPAEVWTRFARPGSVFREVDLARLAPDDRYRFVRADGEVLTGRVLVHRAPLEFAGTLESHGDGMLRFGYEDCLAAPEAHVWLATWGLSAEAFAAQEAGWRTALARVFEREGARASG
jgi:uncharacterized protein YndB with AHSA1/START domain